jgi:hypothetical protein
MYFVSRSEMNHSDQMEEINILCDYKAVHLAFKIVSNLVTKFARPYIGIRAV